MKCDYCDTSDYRGKLFDTCKNIDGGKQCFEVGIFDSPEDERHVIEISGMYTEVRIEINYCPMCGRKI
jgi:hypothetical protein